MNSEEIFAHEAELLRKGLQEWADEGTLSPERSAELEALVRKRMAGRARAQQPATAPRRRWLWGVAAAVVVAAIAIPVAVPPARAWVMETFPGLARFFDKQVESEPGWAWAEEHGMFQEVLASAEDREYTFRVHRVLADPTQTIIIYSVEGPEPAVPAFWAGGGIRFNGEEILGGSSSTYEVIDGVLVGSIETGPLPDVSGTLEIDLRQIGDVAGNWSVSCTVTREPLTALTREIQVNQGFTLGDGRLLVTQVELLPTNTVAHLRYEGPGPAPELVPGMVKLTTPEGSLQPRSLSGTAASGQSEMTWEYVVDFQPVPEGTAELTLQVEGVRMPVTGEQLTLPLEVGSQAAVADLPAATVVEADRTQAVVSWPDSDVDYSDWWVVDNRGTVHPTSWSAGKENGTVVVSISWDPLPVWRRPVSLVARQIQVWQEPEGSWEIRIPLN